MKTISPQDLPDDMYGNANVRDRVIGWIKEERLRHRELGFSLKHSNLEWLRILTEENGEVAKAMQDDPKEIKTEVIQLAAAAVAFLEAIELAEKRAEAGL